MAERVLTVKIPGDRTRSQVDLPERTDRSAVSIKAGRGFLLHRIDIPEHIVFNGTGDQRAPSTVSADTRLRWGTTKGVLRRAAGELGADIDALNIRRIVSASVAEVTPGFAGFGARYTETGHTAEMDVPSTHGEAEVRILKPGEEKPVTTFTSVPRRFGLHPAAVLQESVVAHSDHILAKQN